MSPRSPESPPAVAFVSLGCPKNLVDSEAMLGALSAAGCRLVSDHREAEVVVINTCGFLEASREESLQVIGEALAEKAAGTIRRVVVAGCLVQRHRAKLLEWAPGIDAMIGVFDRDHINDAVRGGPGPAALRAAAAGDPAGVPRYWIAANALQAARARAATALTVNGRDGRGAGYFENDAERLRLTPRHWTYLRVSEGCNQACAFCTIPSIRGKMRSKAPERVLTEARRLMADGAYELNLIGQDTTNYGVDIGYDGPGEGLVGLLTALDGVARDFGGGRIRLMYAYPTNFTDAMIDALGALPNVARYLDIPIQHVTGPMLARMRRRISRAEQEALLEKLRDRIPGLAVRTTLITGFPGETEADHRELVDFVESFQFDMLGVFRYSREAGTPAGTMDLDPALHVPEPVKARREAEIMLAQQQLAFENARYLAEQGCRFDVLIDGPAPGATDGATDGESGPRAVGRCYHQAPEVDSVTYVNSAAPLTPGALVPSTIVGADGYDLLARPTAELERTVPLEVL